MLILWLGLHIFCRALVRAGASYAGREIWLHFSQSMVTLTQLSAVRWSGQVPVTPVEICFLYR